MSVATLAYTEACDKLLSEFEELLKNKKFMERNDEIGSSYIRLKNIACRDLENDNIAQRYARAVTFTDNVRSPEALADEFQSQVESGSLLTFVGLILDNSSHFWPEAQSTWKHYHLEAIRLAERANEHPSPFEQQQVFDLALIYTAFADHHLQDAFASGHSGFARINSSANASHNFHNYWNSRGRYFRGRNIGENFPLEEIFKPEPSRDITYTWDNWCAFGDGHLKSEITYRNSCTNNKKNREKMLIANRLSIRDFLLAFAGLRDRQLSQAVALGFPVYAEEARLDFFTFISPEILEDRECAGAKKLADFETTSYVFDRKCWRSLDDPFLETAFPLVMYETGVRSGFGMDPPIIPLISFEYTLYQYFRKWPPGLRFTYGLMPWPIDGTFLGETGLVYDLGSFHKSPVSHSLTSGYTAWHEDAGSEHRFYTDYNLRLDFSYGIALSLDIGFQVPEAQPRIGATLSYTLGAAGGGHKISKGYERWRGEDDTWLGSIFGDWISD